MATVAELRSRIDTLQRELDGMSPVNTKPVQVQVGTREERVGRGSRTVPVYATVNETTQNADYFSKLSALNKARDQYQTAGMNNQVFFRYRIADIKKIRQIALRIF